MYQRTNNYERLYLIISEPKYTPESYVFKARLPVTSDATPVFSKLKSCGLIHSGFHLSVRISMKLSKQSVLLEGLGEGKGGGGGEGGEVEGKGGGGGEGGVEGKISLAQ